jgi:hypothetical protein
MKPVPSQMNPPFTLTHSLFNIHPNNLEVSLLAVHLSSGPFLTIFRLKIFMLVFFS